METKYPTMRRPKRKLCYIPDKEKESKQWEMPVTVVDVDKLFDDIDSCWTDLQPPSALLDSSDTESPKEDDRSLSQRPASPNLDIDLNFQPETHGPIKTSSPIEQDMGVEKDDKEEEITASPVLFNCEDEMAEELHKVPPQETPKKKGMKKVQENTELLDPAVSQRSVASVSVNAQRAGEIASQVARDKTAFLAKFKVDTQSSKKSVKKAQVVAPPPPDPEDDFLILEEDAPYWFSIPGRSVSKRKQRQSSMPSSANVSSTDKGTVEVPSEIPLEKLGLEKKNDQLESQAADQKNKKKKGKEKTQKLTKNGKINDDLADYQDFPADDLEQQEKEKNLQRVASKKRLKAEVQSKDKSNEESDNEKPSEKMQTNKKSAKDGKKPTKKSIEKPVKEGSKQTQRGLLERDVADVGPITNKGQQEPTEDLHLLTAKKIVESKENKKNKKMQLPVESGGSSSENTQKTERRKRKPVGQWWLGSERSEENPNQQPKLKKLKDSKKPSTALCSPAEAQKQPVGHFSEQKKEKKPKRTKKTQNAEEVEYAASKATGMEQQEMAEPNLDQVQSSHMVCTPSRKSGDQIFQKVYSVCSAKMSTPAAAANAPLCEPETGKRRRKPPGDWWTVSKSDDYLERISSKPQPLRPKEPKPCRANKQSKRSKSAEPAVLQNGNVATPGKAAGGALEPLRTFLSPPKSVRRSLKDAFPAAAEPPHDVSSHSAGECSYSDFTAGNTFDKDVMSKEVGKSTATRSNRKPQPNLKRQSDMLKALQSGPSSMIVMEQYEDNDDTSLKSSHLRPALCVSDLCAPPLRPLALHPKDKANLNEWLQALWSTTSDSNQTYGAAVTAEHFEWFSYQDRALGFQVDLNNGSICSGKILLGSHMKKPLWVDHSATTVFNILTSTVRVNVNSTAFCLRPGQSFIVECGQAYSLQNLNSEPAVVYFTRIRAESSD